MRTMLVGIAAGLIAAVGALGADRAFTGWDTGAWDSGTPKGDDTGGETGVIDDTGPVDDTGETGDTSDTSDTTDTSDTSDTADSTDTFDTSDLPSGSSAAELAGERGGCGCNAGSTAPALLAALPALLLVRRRRA